MMTAHESIHLVETETEKLLAEIEQLQKIKNYFQRGKAIARRLGAHYRGDGLTEIGFWSPELISEVMQMREIYLEVLTPVEDIDWQAGAQRLMFRRDKVELKQEGEFLWGVVAGMRPGTRQRSGSFYWLRYIDQAEKLRALRDPFPYSLPYGVFAPAELYDLSSYGERGDLAYLQRTSMANDDRQTPRVAAPHNILQIHIGTATAEGTFGSLTRLFQAIAHKINHNIPLTPAEKNYLGYDAIQLLPTEPTIEFRDEYSPESEFFSFISEEGDQVEIELNKPHTQDWGYDVPIIGSSTTNPALLESLRPDEVIDFIVTLHNFPTGPIQLIYDLVYGHADNQTELLVSRQFLKGPNMYGLDLNHQLPMVRAALLEMQRRKINTGADGIRIDGGQDFRFFNPLSGRVEYDDAYLLNMANVPQEIDGCKRLLFTIFEDGRPWPEEGWETKSTYRELIEMMPESYQWGPLIFAHNTPALKGFWKQKWFRVQEVMAIGSHWITGCGNHDTVRRGNQIDLEKEINWQLGDKLADVIHHAYDNLATNLWVYGFSPGLPMDFINATMRSPWLFFRNTDERYGVKVVSEEIGFLNWQITPEIYRHGNYFKRLKLMGFKQLSQLLEFGRALQAAMIQENYNLHHVVELMRGCADRHCIVSLPPMKELMRSGMVRFLKRLNEERLQNFALMFMEDCFEVCNVAHFESQLQPEHTEFNWLLRRFRQGHPWLRENLGPSDRFELWEAEDFTQPTLFYGLRHHPNGSGEAIAMVNHLEGEPVNLNLQTLLGLELEQWSVGLATPSLGDRLDDLTQLELRMGDGLLLTHRPQTQKPQPDVTKD